MVPEFAEKTFTPSFRSIRINPVKGFVVEPVSVWQVPVPSLDNDQFQQALIAALRKSNLFSSVSTDIDGDYSLSAKLIGQQGIDVRSLLVRYTLIETAIGKVLWQENILSQHFESVSDVFEGSKRSRVVLQRVMQKNLELLLEKLNTYVALPAGEAVTPAVPVPVPEPVVEPVPAHVEQKVEPVASYPHKLTSAEIAEHFKRYKRLSFYKTPERLFTITVEPGGYLVRYCPTCRTTEGTSDLNIKKEQDLVCFSWSPVTYPSSSCFELFQIDEQRYQLVDPIDGETYAYTAK